MTPIVFDALHRQLGDSAYCTLADTLQVIAASTVAVRCDCPLLSVTPWQVIADDGRLCWLSTGGFDWFGEATVSALASPFPNLAVRPEWRARARSMLERCSPRMRGVFPSAAAELPPVYNLGDMLGEGGSSTVRAPFP